jgi:hypothetical protein
MVIRKKKTRKKKSSRSSRVLMLFRNGKTMFSPTTGDPFMKNNAEAVKYQAFYREHYPNDDFVVISSSRKHAEKFRRTS